MSDNDTNKEQPDTKDLTETQVIIIGCVCAAILIILLVILIIIICRRRQRKSNYQNEGGTRSQHPIQPVNGSAGIQKPQQRGVDNPDSNDDPYFDKPGDISYVSSHSPQTPTKDPKQFIHLVPEEHKGGSGNESGYSTPDPAKPKKVIYEVVV